MNSVDANASVAPQGSARAALVWGIVAVVLTLIAMLRIPMAAVFVWVLLLLGLASGVLAVVLGIRSMRRPGVRSGSIVGAVLGGIAGIAAVIMLAVTLPGLAGGAAVQVELRASGDGDFSVVYTNDSGQITGDSIDGQWRAMFGSRENATEMTVTSADAGFVRCEILRGGAVVAEESSDGGSVTCRFSG